MIFLQSGDLVPTGYSLMRRGGSACVTIACTGCGSEVDYASSSMSATENIRNWLLRLHPELVLVVTTSFLVATSEVLPVVQCFTG